MVFQETVSKLAAPVSNEMAIWEKALKLAAPISNENENARITKHVHEFIFRCVIGGT